MDYIGARYVIKVYENSLDPESNEWEQVNYEPFILVSSNFGSYLSKKFVPASVGRPEDNPAYWCQTGFYNGQIAELQQKVTYISSRLLVSKSTVSDMIDDDTLVAGKVVMTAGYHSINDGGNAVYVIVNAKTPGHIYEDLDNGKYAEMVIDETVSIKQLGATQDADINPYIQKYLDAIDEERIDLYIPSGTWICSPMLINKSNAHIIGDNSFTNRGTPTTIIKAKAAQDYIWKLGAVSDMLSTELAYDECVMSSSIEGICFNSENQLNYAALVLEYCTYSLFKDIFFIGVVGGGLYMRSSWENRFYDIVVRAKTDFSKPAIKCADVRPIAGVAPNISSCIFDHFILEYMAGDGIEIDNGSGFVNNYIGALTIEWSTATQSTDEVVSADPSAIETHVINGNPKNTYIDCIVVAGADTSYYKTAANIIYHQGAILNIKENVNSADGDMMTLSIGSINARQRNAIVSGHDSYIGMLNIATINLEAASASVDDVFNIDKVFNNIEVGAICCRNGVNDNSGIPLYKYAIGQDVASEDTASNKLKLVTKQTSGTWLIQNVPYPFDASAAHKALMRVKGNAGDQFTFRNVLNASNVNQIITLSDTGWNLVEIAITADFDSEVGVLYATTGLMFDTIQFVY